MKGCSGTGSHSEPNSGSSTKDNLKMSPLDMPIFITTITKGYTH
jgi:hypothetical protein